MLALGMLDSLNLVPFGTAHGFPMTDYAVTGKVLIPFISGLDCYVK